MSQTSGAVVQTSYAENSAFKPVSLVLGILIGLGVDLIGQCNIMHTGNYRGISECRSKYQRPGD